MKKILFILLMVLTSAVGMAQTIGDVFYVYRNDGMINTFFRSEVDSMAYSYYDADSIRYDEIVTQVVYTSDSIYQIPLAVIDSVGFVTPETKYHPGVVKLEGTIRDYIIGSDSLTVFFRSETPSNILPRKGDKLVTTEMSEAFMGGFLGQVEEKEQKGDSIALHCSAIGIEEAFECFYYTTNGESHGESNKAKAIGWDWNGYYAPGPFAFSFTSFLNANIKTIDCPIKFLKLPPKLDITIAPTFHSKGSIIVHPLRGVVISVDIKQHTSFTQDLVVSGGIGVSHDFAPDLIPMYPILPFVSIYGEMGFFLKANMNLSLEGHWNQSLDYDIHYEASYLPVMPMPISTTIPKFTINNVNLATEHNEEFMIDGSVSGGLYGEIGIVPLYSKYIAKAGFRFEAGIKIGGNAMLYNSDGENSLFSTSTYERLKAGELYVKPFCTVGLQTKLLDIGKADVNLFKKEWDLCRFKLVPDFENTTLTRDEDIPSILWASTTASGSTIVPSTLGFKLFDGKEQEGIKGLESLNYWNPLGYPIPYSELFRQKSLMKSYTVYPTVNLFGIEMLAEPRAEIGIGATPITLEAEEITDTSAKVWGRIEGHELLDENMKLGLGYIDAGSTGIVMYDASSIDADGVFSVEFKALKPNTTYEYFAYLIVDGDTYYGENKEFTTREEEIKEAYYVGGLHSCTYYFDGKCESRGGHLISQEHNVSSDYYEVIFDSSFSNFHPIKFSFEFCPLVSIENLNYLNTSHITDMSNMFADCRISNLDLGSFNTDNVTDMHGMFRSCKGLQSLNLNSFNTEKVKDMSYMFYNCTSLTDLNMNSFNTASVTDMTEMFANCKSLTSLDLSTFNTANVENMESMFSNCRSLKNLDFRNFNTSNLSSYPWIFAYCDALETIDMRNLVLTNEKGQSLFSYLEKLQELNLSNANTSNATNMAAMFINCKSLESLDLSSFNTANVTNMGEMFESCSAMINLNLNGFNTSKVTNMSSMFALCSSLTSLDLSSFNTANVDYMVDMFRGCSSLKTIYAGDWNKGGIRMFKGCTNLTGSRGTKIGQNVWGYDKYGKPLYYYCGDGGEAAHIDGGKDNPGLF